MIMLFSGTPGSGKSLHTASVIYWRLKNKKPVIANFDFAIRKVNKRHPEKVPFTYVDNLDLTPAFLVDYARAYWKGKKRIVEGEITLIIDEAQILFNARDWNQKGRADWLKFFTQHRKYGFEIIFVAQFDEMLDRQARALIEYEVIHRKVSNFGFWGMFFTFFGLLKMFVAVKVWYPMKEKVGSEFFLARKKYYSLYDSYGDFGEF